MAGPGPKKLSPRRPNVHMLAACLTRFLLTLAWSPSMTPLTETAMT